MTRAFLVTAALVLAACEVGVSGPGTDGPQYGDPLVACRAAAEARGLSVVSISAPGDIGASRTPGRSDYILGVRGPGGARHARCIYDEDTGRARVTGQNLLGTQAL